MNQYHPLRIAAVVLFFVSGISLNAQTDITFTLNTDCWGNETSWGVYDDMGAEIIGVFSGNLANLTEFIELISLADGCYELRIGDTYGDGLNGTAYGCSVDGNYSLQDENGVIIAQLGEPDFDNLVTHAFCLPYVAPPGCNDSASCNFNPLAGSDDGSCEYLSCAGCTDSEACNYIDTATIDNGCEYVTCAGCLDVQADNYDVTATIDDGSCSYPPLVAVISASSLDICPGGSLSFSANSSTGNIQSYTWEVSGPETLSDTGVDVSFVIGLVGTYTITLIISDGTLSNSSSVTVESADGDNLLITVVSDNYPQEISYVLLDDNGNTIAEVLLGDMPAGTSTSSVCLTSGCHSFIMSDSYGDGLLGAAYYSLTLNGVELINSSGYGTGETTPLNCPVGTSCFDAIVAVEGTNTAIYDNTWFIFSPAVTGQYNVTTCGTAICNTTIWVYDYCQGLPWDDTNEATIYYNDDDISCTPQSNINPLLEAGLDYYIRIGDQGDDCPGDVDFNVSFVGAISGCLDINACNFEPLATVGGGTCYYNEDPECSNLGPDLFVLQSVLQTSTYLTSLTDIQPDDCYIQEGCIAGTGDRDIVRFTTHIKNIGTQDYFIGQESDNTNQFEFDPCHGHYHYEGYAEYILYDNSGVEYPEIGFKNGFCVLDLECSDGGTAKYGCNNMGISAGCGDYYSSGLACQWVDVTTLAAGVWTLVVRTNWTQSPDNNGRYELRYDNNWAQVCFSFGRDVDGNIIDFNVEPVGSCAVPTDCLGQPFGDAQPDCNGDCPGLVVRGDANLSLEIEATDAQIYVDDILGNDAQVTPCSDMDSDNAITVSDAAALSRCAIYGTNYIDEFGAHNHCEWISEVTNQNQTTTLSIGEINTTDGYVDVFVLNPDNRIVGYEFEISGLEILSVENLYTTDYTMTPQSTLGGTKVIGLSYSDESIAKNLAPAPMVRVYYSGLTGTEVCVSNITDIVNVEYHNTLTAIGSCMAVAQGDFADFVGGPTNICQGEVVNFNDTSSGVISTWDWNFPGGTPSSSTDQNPVITYNTAGIYDVILTVGNGTEIDSETKTGFVTVMAGTTFYLDSDADGYGDINNSIVECSPVSPAGYSENSLDCDDTNSNISPEASETCNGIDDNCDGNSDEGLALVTYYADEDSDGFGDDLVSQDSCDGGPIGYVTVGGDCDDSNDNVYAGAPGTREGLDNDCDGDIEGDEIYVCIGDINSDGMVNIYDLTGLLGDFGCSENCYADLDFDGNVSTGDIAIFLSVFGSLCE